ncbi:MAG: MOSC domain-containing protein [Acidimicrobiales bacterium]
MAGTVVGIFTAPEEGAATVAVDEVVAVKGRGLQGDRYFDVNQGDHDPGDEITLIDADGLRVARTEHGVALDPGEHRRNVVVEGLDLVELVGQVIQVGEIEVEVLADNPPCKYLQTLTGKPVLRALQRKGGVRGRIAKGGTIRLGDPIQP